MADESVRKPGIATPVATDENIALLFALVRDEQRHNSLRWRTLTELHDLKTFLPSLDGAEGLLSNYETLQIFGNDLLDRFTHAALKLIPGLGSIPSLTPIDLAPRMEVLQSARDSKDPEETPDELDADIEEEEPALLAGAAATALEPSVPRMDLCDMSAASRRPTYASPETDAFTAARLLSDDVEREHESGSPPEQILQSAITYLISACTPASAAFHADDYQHCLKWLASMNARSEIASWAASNSSAFMDKFSDDLMLDGWVHVRHLLAALRLEVASGDERQCDLQELRKSEYLLMSIFSLVRSAMDDPLPWFLVLAGIQRLTWRIVRSEQGEPPAFQVKLFKELCLWCNATALNAVVVRFPGAKHRWADTKMVWYQSLFESNPRCANEECMRLLPHPDTVQSSEDLKSLSVGTREARVGQPRIRKFISTNRKEAYACLYRMLNQCRPHADLVTIFFWFSHLYHDVPCKQTRGKRAINAF